MSGRGARYGLQRPDIHVVGVTAALVRLPVLALRQLLVRVAPAVQVALAVQVAVVVPLLLPLPLLVARFRVVSLES